MRGIVIFFKKLFGIPLTDLDRLYDHKGPVLVITPKPFPETPAPAPLPDPKPSNDVVLGIDCARYQKGIRWPEVAAAGVKFAINKATDGEEYVDPLHASHRAGARSVGIVPGHYHFFRFKGDPLKQARHFVQTVQTLAPGELCLALDVEWDNSSGGYLKYRDGGEMDDQAAAAVLICLAEIERLAGVTPWIYTAPGFWTGKFKAPERFSRFPLWLNDFKAKSVTQLRTPKMTWQRPVVWQYGEQPMAGVGGVDLNRFLGSLDEFKAMIKK